MDLRRSTLLGVLVLTLWIANLVDWPFVPYLDLAKPTLIAVAFVMLSHRLKVASWPVVITFSLSFFAFVTAQLLLGSTLESTEISELPARWLNGLAIAFSLVLSPVTLWGPVAGSALLYAWYRRTPPNRALESSRPPGA
jgi:hypothetical protein